MSGFVRPLAFVALALLVPGCAGEGAEPALVATVSGSIRESGPAYTFHGGVCGRPLNSLEFAGEALWFTWAYNGARPGDGVLVVSTTAVQEMDGSGCGGDLDGYLRGLDGPGRLQVLGYDGHSEEVDVSWAGDVIKFAGQTVAPGQSASIHVVWTAQRKPSLEDTRDGTYTYEGDITLRNLGRWDGTRIHAVQGCTEMPSGC